MSLPSKSKFDPALAIDDKGGKPSQAFRDYMAKLDALITTMTTGMNVALVSAANDAAAAAAGVQVGQLYRNGSVIQVRVV